MWRRYAVTTTHTQNGSYEGIERSFYTYLFWKDGDNYFIEKYNENGSLGKVSFDGSKMFRNIIDNASIMVSETPEDYAYSDHGSVYFAADDAMIGHTIFIRTPQAYTQKPIDPAGMQNTDGKNVNYVHNSTLKLFETYHDMKSMIETYAAVFPPEKF